jgi:hypothetical protein
MSVLRGTFGAVVGALFAGTALRVRHVVRQRGLPLSEVIPELPDLLADDARWVGQVAREAARDGLRAAQRREAELDKVLFRPAPQKRRTRQP